MSVPYWRCIPDAKPDPVVLRQIEKRYRDADTPTRIKWLQETLRDYGFDVKSTGTLDERTKLALDQVAVKFNFQRRGDHLEPGLFVDLFVNVPLSRGARAGERTG